MPASAWPLCTVAGLTSLRALTETSVQAAYIRVPASARAALRARELPFRDGLHAASHALLNVLPLRLMVRALGQ